MPAFGGLGVVLGILVRETMLAGDVEVRPFIGAAVLERN